MISIDAPSHAVAIWLEGDKIMVRFPDRQLVMYDSPIQLMLTLQHRADSIKRKRPMTVGTEAAPVQYDIDTVALALKEGAKVNGHEPTKWDELVKQAGDRVRNKADAQRKRRLNADAKRIQRKEYADTLAAAGL
jgi:hypothetical protein